MTEAAPYDAVLVVSFGGPEGPDDVMPFLENVLRGKNVPRQRMLEVAEHYKEFGGVSPINEQNRQLIAALKAELDAHGPKLPVYWGNRNWHPLLPDTLRHMRDDGVRHAIAYFTSAYSSYSGCRQYREDIQRARAAVGEESPIVDKLRVFFNHPGFIEPIAELTRQSMQQLDPQRRSSARLLFTAHSIPLAMASNCNYQRQLQEASRLVAERVGTNAWDLVYQSRSGPPSQPWLEPDICDQIRQLQQQAVQDVVVIPIGFVSDHMEVLFDLDTEARELADELQMGFVRVPCVGTHPRFVTMIRQLIDERVSARSERPALGELGPSHDVCPEDCCLSGRPRPA